MYVARVTITRNPGGSATTVDVHALRRLIEHVAAQAHIEHFHLALGSHKADVTLFVQTGSQIEADAVAHLVGCHLCNRLPGWRLDHGRDF